MGRRMAAYRGATDGKARRVLALGHRYAEDLLTNLQPGHLGSHPLLVLGGARVEDLDEQLDLGWGRLRRGWRRTEGGARGCKRSV